jgi:hypothetical protein
MGGAASLASIQDVTVSGQLQAADQSGTEQFTWKSLGLNIRHEYAMADGNHVSVVTGAQGQSQGPDGTITPINIRSSITILPYHMPGVLIHSLLASANASLVFISQPSSDPQYMHVYASVQLAQANKSYLTQQEWEFDPATNLPIKVTFYLPDVRNSIHDGNATIQYTAWQNATGVLVPQSLSVFSDGVLQSTVTLSVPLFNQGLTLSDFQLQ